MTEDDRRARRALGALWLVACAATLAMWRHPSWFAAAYDWRYFESAMEAARRTVAWFHELPLYNPYMCGGEPQLANPQSIAGSPAFALVLLFGTAIGERLMLLLFVGLGLDGSFRLARHLGLALAPALTAALAFGLSGWVAQHFAIGHVSFFGATLVPYALYFYLRGKDDARYAIALGATMAIIVAQGGTSTAAMAAISLFVVALADAVAERSPTAFRVLALGAVAALLLGAYRLFPALEFAIDHPRRVVENDGQSPLELLRGALLWSGGTPPGHRYGFHEYAWHLAYVAWPLAVLGLARKGPLRRLALALVVGGGTIALGRYLGHGPWWLMSKLPVLRDLRVPSRYSLLPALGVSLLAGAGLGVLAEHARGRARLVAAIVVAAVAIEGAVYVNLPLATTFDLRTPPIDRREPFYQVRGHWSQMLDLVLENRGVIGCDEEAPLTRAATLDEGPQPQLRLDDPGAGTLRIVRYSPDLIEADVALTRPASLLPNLNWNEHWKASTGALYRYGAKVTMDKDGGRLALRLPAMSGRVTLRYRPTSFVIGFWVSLLSALVSVWVWRRAARRSVTM